MSAAEVVEGTDGPQDGAEVVPVVTMVPDHVTGEAVELRTADDERLVDYLQDTGELVDQITASQGHVLVELRRRMDRDGKWTRRIGDASAGSQWEATCPSPDAGTTYYLADELYGVLQDLVGDDIISTTAAEGAIKRTISVTFAVPFDVPTDAIADAIRDAGELNVAGAKLEVAKVDADAKPNGTGVKTLRKVPAVAKALDAIVKENQPERKVRLKQITRER